MALYKVEKVELVSITHTLWVYADDADEALAKAEAFNSIASPEAPVNFPEGVLIHKIGAPYKLDENGASQEVLAEIDEEGKELASVEGVYS